MKTRIDYLDIAKGIGILTVVWAHILLTGISHRVIYAFHMPLFFVISGMLFRREKYSGLGYFLKRRAKRLLVPFVVYSVVTWIIWACFRFVRHDSVISYWDPLLQTVIAKGSGAYMVHNSALWFIPCLFATEILYYAISHFNEYVRFILCALCAITSFWLGDLFGNDWWFLLPWNFDAALIGVLFYCVGNLFSRHISGDTISGYVKKRPVNIFLWLILLSSALYWGATRFGECSMGSSSYQCSGLIFIVRAIVGTSACILLSLLLSLLPVKNILKTYLTGQGKASLDIMSIHIPVKGIVIMGLSLIVHQTGDYISTDLLYSTISFLITMVVVDVMVEMIGKGKILYKNHVQRFV